MPADTDSIMRITARDLFMILLLFKKNKETTLENIRLRLCVDRKKKRRGTYLWSTAKDIGGELRKLGLIDGGPFPRDRRQYPEMSGNILMITKEGREFIEFFETDRGHAYDSLLKKMYEVHLYLRYFVRALKGVHILAPVLTSVKDHISMHYRSAAILAEDVANGKLETDDLIDIVSQRIGRNITPEEKNLILQEIDMLLVNTSQSAAVEERSEFGKKFLLKLNEIIIPEVLRSVGLGFDYRTHRTLWLLGQEFFVWWATTSHPAFDGTLVFSTADIHLSADEESIDRIEFNTGLQKTEEVFLSKLFNAYETLQKIKGISYVPAWELRSVFCYENRCQPSIFNRLFGKNYTGSDELKIHLEIQRTKPLNEEPLVAGKRKIGTVRVTRIA